MNVVRVVFIAPNASRICYRLGASYLLAAVKLPTSEARTDIAASTMELHESCTGCHTYATLALRLGTHPVLVSERLGHTSIAVTIDRYSHVIPSIDRHAADVVAEVILPS